MGRMLTTFNCSCGLIKAAGLRQRGVITPDDELVALGAVFHASRFSITKAPI